MSNIIRLTSTMSREKRRIGVMLAVVTALDQQPAWRDAVRLNELTQKIEVVDPWPPRDADDPRAWRPLRDPGDVLKMVLWLQGNGHPKAGKGLCWDVLCYLADRNSFHPVRDYLNRLKWDGTPRVHMLFTSYFNAALPDEDDATPPGQLSSRDRQVAYLEHIARCFMVGAVARVQRPGCKVDHIPVPVGQEGLNKSQAIAALCPDAAWFSDDLSPDLMERDTKESLTGKWIIELSEMPHARREVERVKAFFSRTHDRYRNAYGRSSADHPRQNVFIGTSNNLELISDTGNRRFWPFEVAAPIDIARIVADRDQLWAEAMDLYRRGEQWWLPPAIEIIATEQQEAFAEHDIWEDKMREWLDARPCGSDGKELPFLLEQPMVEALGYRKATEAGVEGTHGIDARGVSKTDVNRAASCLRRLGYVRGRLRRINGKRGRWWVKNVKTRKL